jgi:glucose-6-phosphate 1-dehydrogenase
MTGRITPVQPFDLVVFGGTGDLARRKLMPSLYYRDRDGQLPDACRIVGSSRRELGRDEYTALIERALREHVEPDDLDAACLRRFLGRLSHVAVDVEDGASPGWRALGALLAEHDDRIRVYYLAMAPQLFGPVCAQIAASGLATDSARVVLEKPIGHDLASARAIHDCVGSVFDEEQIFRIDHYLGKETVQNLMVLRFANALFEPQWNSGHIDHVQITVAERIGVEGRGAYYDQTGALRDMVQNHMLQLLCLVAMEPPSSLGASAVRDEKLKVLRALARVTPDDAGRVTVRGQYGAGAVDGASVPGYREEAGRGATSTTETFVALKAQIDNWRWAGVPFYLRTGKRMPVQASEIVIRFRTVPYSIFGRDAGVLTPNILVLRLQPDEGVRLYLTMKEPGPGSLRLNPAPLNLDFSETFTTRYPGAYERLLMDVVRGDATLFMRRDEVEAAWCWVEPILEAWSAGGDAPRAYAAGTWGPAAAIELIERDGRTWWEPHT